MLSGSEYVYMSVSSTALVASYDMGIDTDMNADFRRLKFTHNGTHVLDEVTDTRKLQCEVFFLLPLIIAESHCTRLSGSSVRFREAMMR